MKHNIVRLFHYSTLEAAVNLCSVWCVSQACAMGELYIDDGHSFQYLHKKQFLYRKFTFHKNVLSSR